MQFQGFRVKLISLRDMALLDFFFYDSRKTTKSVDFGLFFDFACFQASFDVFCMRWDVRNIILEVQTMGSEGLQACKHSKFQLSRPFWRQKSPLRCLPLPFTGYRCLVDLLVSGFVWRAVSEESCWKCDCGCVGSVLSTKQANLNSKIQK